MLSDVDKAFCVETYISSKSFDQTRQLLARKLGWDHRKTHLAQNNAAIVIIINDGLMNYEVTGYFAGKSSGRIRSVR